MNKNHYLWIAMVVTFSWSAHGQGCSDAGFCTLNSLKPSAVEFTQQIKFGVTWGKADHNVQALANHIEYNRKFNDKWGLDVKLTSLAQIGNGLTVFQLSDAYLNAHYAINEKLKGILGFKIPFHAANKRYSGETLPMDYQSSLGTFDVIAGVALTLGKIQGAIAWQQPLTQNQNEFRPDDFVWRYSELSKIHSTNEFKRKGDVLLRGSYRWRISDKFTVSPAVLMIYHLGKDLYTDQNGVQQSIQGSDGLTINLLAFVDYQLSQKSAIQLSFGAPMVVRKIRPDGLTRSYSAVLEYRYMF